MVGGHGADPEHAGGIIYLVWPWNASGYPRGAGKSFWGEGHLDCFAQAVAPMTQLQVSS